MKVAVIEGGYSHEKQISEKSALTVRFHLMKNYDVYRVIIDKDGWFCIYHDEKIEIDKNSFSFTYGGKTVKFDYAFIVIHGTPGEDGKLQSYFDMLQIPYNTSNHLLTNLTFNKFYCNRVLESLGYKVAKAKIIIEGEAINTDEIIQHVGLPCFVKPADGGSSFGVTRVEEADKLENAIDLALQHGNQALIEEYLSGREVTNGIYKGKSGIRVLPITEIVTENEFFDFAAKYNGESKEITPADLPDALTNQIKATSLKIFKDLKFTGLARIDYILKDNEPYVIEINTVPGQSDASIVPQMVEVEGLSLGEVFIDIIEDSLANN